MTFRKGLIFEIMQDYFLIGGMQIRWNFETDIFHKLL